MPQIKSQMKRIKISEKQRLRNRGVKSALKTHISVFDKAFEAGDKKLCKEALASAIKNLDKAVSKGVIHKNKAAHKKSKLTLKFSAMPEKAPEPEIKPAEKKKKTTTKKGGAKKKTAAKKKTTKKAAVKKTTTKKITAAAKKTSKAATAKKKTATTKKKAATKKSTKKE